MLHQGLVLFHRRLQNGEKRDAGSVSLSPGIGVNKKLPCVGDAFITGIVNSSNSNSHLTLQTTKLSTVVELAEFIAKGILKAAEKRTELHVCSSFKCPI